jgi:hypothetical protein
MALCATDRQSQPNGSGRVDSINDSFDSKLFRICAAFLIHQRIAMKACRDQLLLRRRFQQITRQLFDRKLIENGMSSFNALITQSRNGQIDRSPSIVYP